MSLRNRVRLVAIIPVVLWLAVSVRFLPPERIGSLWMLLTAILAVIVGMFVANVVTRTYLNRFRVAIAREDLPTARRLVEGLTDFYRWRGREVVKTYGINILVVEERYQEALDGLRALDMQKIGPKGSPVVKSQMAWCLAQLGEPSKAADLINSVLPQMEPKGPQYLAGAHLVLGVSYFLMGRAAEATPYLEGVYAAAAARTSRKAAAAFYLGETYAALGNGSEARHAFQNATEALPSGRFGIRASKRLAEL
jgi:tetratricopeptide (TPR) repeat protein